jgi:hypothetical protein
LGLSDVAVATRSKTEIIGFGERDRKAVRQEEERLYLSELGRRDGCYHQNNGARNWRTTSRGTRTNARQSSP